MESSQCQASASKGETMTPDFLNCESLSWGARIAAMVLFEHFGFALFLLVYTQIKNIPYQVLAERFESRVLKEVTSKREHLRKHSNLSPENRHRWKLCLVISQALLTFP
uniref:Uncharacterized protein n=1 Tax=Aplanochytrium stocchinoi TaxID=215587 RepID=A0A7S3LKD8_9STRA|mmetsp:Transcript_517/g.629  ORF Transcript_517/g.629 Transcript_517/m.629 type:complete len:109 (-) Transcript_517:713-1039(-)